MLKAAKPAENDEKVIEDVFGHIILKFAARVADPETFHYPTHGEVLTAAAGLMAKLMDWNGRCDEDYDKVVDRWHKRAKTGCIRLKIDRMFKRPKTNHMINRRFMQGRALMLHVWDLPDEVRIPMQLDFADGDVSDPFKNRMYLDGVTTACRQLVQSESIDTKDLYVQGHDDRLTVLTKREHRFLIRTDEELKRCIGQHDSANDKAAMAVAIVARCEALTSAATRELAFRFLERFGVDPASRNVLSLCSPEHAEAIRKHAAERSNIALYF